MTGNDCGILITVLLFFFCFVFLFFLYVEMEQAHADICRHISMHGNTCMPSHSSDICCSRGPIFKGKVTADNDLKPFLPPDYHKKKKKPNPTWGGKEERKQGREMERFGPQVRA